MLQRSRVAREGWELLRGAGFEGFDVLGEIVVGEAGLLVVDAVVGLVEEREGEPASEAGARDDVASGAIDRVAGEADVLDVFAPALEIAGDEGGDGENAEEVGPDAENGYEGENEDPSYDDDGELDPDAAAEFLVS